ncbi:MAG: hypothetical protein V1776_01735 [Candidatus Diapherotrites archaeon]
MKGKVVVGVILLIVIVLALFLTPKENVESVPNSSPLLFYQCKNISNKIIVTENTIFFENLECPFTKMNPPSAQGFFSDNNPVLVADAKLVLDDSCKNLEEKVSGMQVVSKDSQGIFSSNGSFYYCLGLAPN